MSTCMNTEPSTNGTHHPPRPDVLAVKPAGIPEDLKERPCWLTWRYVYMPERGKKPWQKPPMNHRTGAAASTTDPKTWSSFDTALAAYEDAATSWDGIGLAMDNTIVREDGLILI